MNLKSIGKLIRQIVESANLIKGPLTLIVVVVLLSFSLCLMWAPKVSAERAPIMIGVVFMSCVVLSILILLVSFPSKVPIEQGPTDASLNALADDLGHKVYMSVTMYFSNFESPEERIEAYKTLVTSITVGADQESTPFRERIARRIREDVKLYEKTDI